MGQVFDLKKKKGLCKKSSKVYCILRVIKGKPNCILALYIRIANEEEKTMDGEFTFEKESMITFKFSRNPCGICFGLKPPNMSRMLAHNFHSGLIRALWYL